MPLRLSRSRQHGHDFEKPEATSWQRTREPNETSGARGTEGIASDCGRPGIQFSINEGAGMDSTTCGTCFLDWPRSEKHPPCLKLSPAERRRLGALGSYKPVTEPREVRA